MGILRKDTTKEDKEHKPLTRSQASIPLEPHRDTDNGWQIDETEAEPSADADGEDQSQHVLRKR